MNIKAEEKEKTMEDIFEEESDLLLQRGRRHEESQEQHVPNKNTFFLSDELRNNINKRLPRGFAMIKKTDMPEESNFTGTI